MTPLQRLLLTLVSCAAGVIAAAAAETPRPNIVFILADDLGWSDTTLYGTTKFYETPNIERLAARGMKFTNAYAAAPICSPTRASIMTGLYPGRLGITTPSGHVPEEKLEASLVARTAPSQKSLQAQSATRLKLEYFTLAEALKEAGYATGHFGKWHLGPEPFDPLHQGFDVDVPHWSGPGPAGYIAPWKQAKFNLPAKPGEHVEDLMSQAAITFIRAHKDEPFYLNYWAFSVHSPWGAKPELIEKYRRKADPKNPQHNAVYGAMVQSLDEAVGRLLDTLDELKLADHTIIVFFSDNGGVNWFEPKMKESEMDCPPTSNAPLRAGKGTLYDGGTREPCALIWPGRIKAGTKSDALFCSVDFFPTLLEMAGLKAKPDLKFDGVSQVSTLLGGNAARDTVFCYYPHYSPPGHVVKTMPGVWVRRGDWKLIRFFNDADDQSDRFELYNLRDDIGETRNLAAESRSKVEELDAIIDRHLRETNALVPGKNPIYNPLAPDFTPSKDATVSLAGGTLVITSTGSNPSISVRDLPKGQGPFTIGLRMKSNGKGDARFFWAANPQEPMNRERAVAFPVQHDGEWHNYSVKLPVETSIGVLRFDPGTAPGEARLEFLRLRDKNDKPVREWSFRGDDYAPGPDSQRQDRVPVGKSFQFKIENSKIFPGTSRTIMVYVPAQYKTDKPACVYVGLDGLGFGVPVVFDNLIHQGEMPVTIAIGVTPGSGAPANGAQNPRFNRSFEFDGLNDNLARFLIEEVLPEVEKHQTPDGLPIHLSKDPNDRCTGGASTGAIGAFTLAWERPDAFRRVFTSVGTFVGMRGGDRYPVLVRKTEPKPLRIFMQDGSNDEWMGGPEVGDWWMANQTMERALEFAGYQVEHVWGTGPHGGKHATAIFPDAMRWLWKDWPQPITSGATQNHVLAAILEPGAEWQLVPNADQSPGSLAAHPNGDVFFYDTASHKVFRITSGGKGIESSAANGNLTAIAFNSEGRLYAADANEAKILAFDAEGKASTIADGICARSLTITHDGNLYATESGDGEAAGRVWLIKANGGKSLLDNGLHHPSGVAPSPDGLWLAVAESKTHWGYSYRVQPDGTVQDKQQFYWFHVPDWADDSGAGSLAMDRSGQMYAATRFGVEVFDRNGRVRAILPGPGGAVTALCFGGTNFDTLFVVSGGRIYQRKFKIPGAPPWSAPVQLPPWGAG